MIVSYFLHHGASDAIFWQAVPLAIALLLAAAMMLDHVQLTEKATQLRQALDATLNIDKVRTGDLGGKANTAEFTQALVSRIANG